MVHKLPWPQPWPKEGTEGPDCPMCNKRRMTWSAFTYVCHPCRISYEDAEQLVEWEAQNRD